MKTEKLYWTDSRRGAFETRGASLSSYRLADSTSKPSLVLKETIFYPEGGGQLGDVGQLVVGGRRVTIADTQVDDEGAIHHLLAEPLPEDVAASLSNADLPIEGTIDLVRRQDFAAQHTAQHALSRALADSARAETVSARLGATTCTIDVSRASIPDVDLHRAEDLVNGLIQSNVDVRALYPTADELARMPLRKQPKVTTGVIRVIDIDSFDLTPCGGTHCTRTGQIGQVRIVGLEKYKGMLRLTFHAGLRALADARTSHDALRAIAADLTCGVLDVPSAVTKLRSSLKETRTQLDAARAELADFVARAALAKLPPPDAAPSPLVVPLLRASDDIGALRTLAGKLTTDARVVALAGGVDPSTGELVVIVQRGASAAAFDCGAFIQAQAKARSGRGGGRPERAEGRFPRGTSLEVIATAAQSSLAS